MASNTEKRVIEALQAARVSVETDLDQRRMPVADWPWKTAKSRRAPTCDLFVPGAGIFIEIKGFMTIHAMAKLAWLAQQDFPYYVFQVTEGDWDPWSESPLGSGVLPNPELSEAKRIKLNVARQVEELVTLAKSPAGAAACSRLTRARVQRYIELRVNEFTSWTGSWP